MQKSYSDLMRQQSEFSLLISLNILQRSNSLAQIMSTFGFTLIFSKAGYLQDSTVLWRVQIFQRSHLLTD